MKQREAIRVERFESDGMLGTEHSAIRQEHECQVSFQLVVYLRFALGPGGFGVVPSQKSPGWVP